MNNAAATPLLTSEVARILGVVPETVRLMERTGRLHAVRTGNGVRLFDREEVERLAAERAQRASASPDTDLAASA